ncbi:hypothetical protein, partial [Thioclava sp. SK-1]|uniref:hypothetical protein n=1 Tax=Thioclava sp. SK-1 TaxID=1889770 RepID=UPI00159EF7D5
KDRSAADLQNPLAATGLKNYFSQTLLRRLLEVFRKFLAVSTADRHISPAFDRRKRRISRINITGARVSKSLTRASSCKGACSPSKIKKIASDAPIDSSYALCLTAL